MNKIVLKDVENWKKLNEGKSFSLYDYIFHIIKSKKVSDDIFFALSELFWPSFIIYKNYILLKENFSIKKFEDLSAQTEKIEFWMNFFITDPYFDNAEDKTEKAEALARILIEIWQLKLKHDFPNLEFKVEYLHDEDGDYGLTFYQISGCSLA